MSETNALVPLGPTAIVKGGQGINLTSRLLQLKPATLSLNQKMTQAKGAIPGKLRIVETGQQFDSMTVALLDTPVEQRAYYEGEEKNNDTRLCFSLDLVTPHKDAAVPQAYKCSGCPKASWEKWRQTKLPKDIPPCETFYKAWLIDTVYQFPLVMYIRATMKKPFEAGLQNLARTLAILKAQGQNPNIWDIKFTLGITEEQNKKKQQFFNIDMSDFKATTPEERLAFGTFYEQLTATRNRAADASSEAEAAEQIAAQTETVSAAVTESAPAPVEGEYVQAAPETITI